MPTDFNRPVGGVARGGGVMERPPAGDAEDRAGVEPIDGLLAERWALVEQVADLQAKHGSFGTWDALRKAELSRIKTLIRLQALSDKRKMTNDQVDEEAHEHPDYTTFVVEGTKERARWFKLDAQIKAIDYRLNRGQALLRYVSSEPRL